VTSVPQVLPAQGTLGRWTRAIEAAALLLAAALLSWHVARFAFADGVVTWWVPLVLIATLVAADFLTGCVHWAADTWGSEDLPVLGRLIRPFRVHHVNPADFLDRSFIDTNGDVALVTVPVLAAALLMPLDTDAWRVGAVAVVSLCVWVLPTNQVHQWAHRGRSPRVVRWLQRAGVALSPRLHARHHTPPYDVSYCILTGWCNRPLAAIDFFRRAERAITAITGVLPRQDDNACTSAITGSNQVARR
jgi:plasmanylethanolamine desaturase